MVRYRRPAMKLRIAFHYAIKYVPFRCFNDRTAIGAGETEVEIREASGRDAHVAFRVGNHKGFDSYGANDRMFDRKPDGGMREIRAHEGKLYVEAENALGLQDRIDADVNATVFAPCRARVDMENDPRHGRKVTTLEAIRREQREPLKSADDDKGAAMVESLRKRASQLLVVDGVIYQRCVEPVLKMDVQYGRRAYVAPRPKPGHVGWDHREIWGDDRDALFEKLADAHLLLASPLGNGSGESVEMRTDWEVVDPRYSVFDGTAHDVTNLATRTFGILTSSADGLPREALDTMYVLRDALEDASGRATPRLVEALREVSLLTSDVSDPQRLKLAAAAEMRRRASYTYDYRGGIAALRAKAHEEDVVGRAAEKAMESIHRWEARPGSGWEDRAGPVSSHRKGAGWCRELLSPGQIIDACHAAGMDPTPVLAAAKSGKRVYQVGDGPSHASAHAIGTMDADGTVTPLGRKLPEDRVMDLLHGMAEAADRTVETAFDMMPMR